MNHRIGYSIVFILLFFSCVIFVTAFKMQNYEKNESECLTLKTLPEVSYCLRDVMKYWYYYNISNLYNNLTEEELKKEGGVCWHYADWFSKKLNKSGYYTKEITFPLGENFSHRITLSSDETYYCINDQLNVECFKMKNNNLTQVQEILNNSYPLN